MDDTEAEAESRKFDPDYLVLEELERRRDLENATTRAAQVSLELRDRGALYLYVMAVRERAAAALNGLIEADPSEALGISRLQADVRAYTNVCTFIDETLKEAEQADQIIEQEYDQAQDDG